MASRSRSRTPDSKSRSGGEVTRTIATQVIAVVLIAGAAHLMPGLVVPLLIALVLAICLSPLAGRLEGMGLHPTLSSLAFTAFFGTILLFLVGLFVYQINAIARETEDHLDQIGELFGDLAERSGFDQTMSRIGMAGAEDPSAEDTSETQSPSFWAESLGRGLEWLSQWIVAGIGGILGIVFGAVVGLIALFLMLRLRELWIERLLIAARHLGLCPNREGLNEVRGQVVTYLSVLGAIASTYVVLISLLLWFLEVPRPLLWGILSGMMEFIPIFGPLLSGTLVTVATLTTGTLWKPIVVASVFIVLHTIEGYVIWPVVFGRVIRFDQVTILVGILFFGGLLGPLGMVLGMPLMILLRGLIAASPGTPALDSLVDVEDCEPAPG